MSRTGFDERRRPIAMHVRRCRERLGYNRKRFGKMLGFTDIGAKRNMAKIEGCYKNISDEKLGMINEWIQNGLPHDAPEPNLHLARAKYFEHRRNEQPRVIELRSSL